MSSAQLKNVATDKIPASSARSPYESLKHQLEISKGEFKPLLGTDTNVDKFIRVVLNACLATPDLLEADRRSLIAASMKAAQDGLMPDGREAVLNIYNTKVSKRGQPDEWRKMAQYLPMVGGLIKKLYESGEITYVDAAAVYANDKFTFLRGDSPKLEHEPTLADDPGIIVAAYVVIKLKNGEVKREVMPRRDIESVRQASKAKDSGPWATWYDQQAIKSVIKRAYKQLPKVDALERIIANDNEAMGFTASVATGEFIKPTKTENMAIENSPTEYANFSGAGLEEVTLSASEMLVAYKNSLEQATDLEPENVEFIAVQKAIESAKEKDDLYLAADLIKTVQDEGLRAKLLRSYENKLFTLDPEEQEKASTKPRRGGSGSMKVE